MKVILAVMCTTLAVVKIRPEKNFGLYRIRTHDLCDTDAALYQLSCHGFKSRKGLNFNPLVISPHSLLKRQVTRENLSVKTMKSNVDISTYLSCEISSEISTKIYYHT